MYLYLFHLFESMISSVATLVGKTLDSTLQQCGLSSEPDMKEQRLRGKDVAETLNTIVTGSEFITATLSANEENQKGFFSENAKQIMKTKKSV